MLQAADEWVPFEFKNKIQGKEGMQFQISFKGKSALYKIGDKIGPWTINAYEEIIKEPYQSPVRDGIAVDKSALTLSRPGTRPEKPEELRLVMHIKRLLR